MKVVSLNGIRDMQVQDQDRPQIKGPLDVLLKIKEVGVCGSDVHYFETGRIGDQIIEYPFLVGHECSAVVEAVGTGVTRVKPGDRVAVDPAIPCFECDQCRAGREHTCRKLLFLGCPGQVQGCLCEYLVMPETSCYLLANGVSFTQGVLSEPLAIAIYAVLQARVTTAMRVGILGAGPIGLSCLKSAQAQGAQACYVTDLIEARLAVARDQGAAWAGNPETEDAVRAVQDAEPGGLDVVFECAGQQETVDQAVAMLKPGGRLMLIGIPRVDRIDFPVHTARRNEITLVNVRRQNGCTQTALDWMAQGKVHVDFMKTHVFPMDRTGEAFELVAGYGDGVIKALIEF
ncbi:MAG: alcohol dehydrogenase catalytic domain-containing protein [Phycisphaerae bacterium]|nr:alcohol dehydrogenase catalytic domain-containing protein [Phycisphaerae bacterium]